MHLCLEQDVTVLQLEPFHVSLYVRVDEIEKLLIVIKRWIGLCKAEEEKDGSVGIDCGPDTLFAAQGKEVSYDEAVELVRSDFGINDGTCHIHQL